MSDRAETEGQVQGGDASITGESTDCREWFDREYLEKLDIPALVLGAEKLLRRNHFDEFWLVYPHACEGSSDWRDLAESTRGLEQLEEILGKKLVGDFDRELQEDQLRSLYHQVGGRLVEGFHANMIQEYEREMGWWRNANWEELFRAGIIPDYEYRELMENCPDRNPRC